MSIAAAVVQITFVPAALAPFTVSTQGSRATADNGAHNFPLDGAHVMRIAVRISVTCEDIRQLDSWSLRRRRTILRDDGHTGLLQLIILFRQSQQVQRTLSFLNMLLCDVKVLDGRVEAAVPHQYLDRSHVNPRFQEMGREAVA